MTKVIYEIDEKDHIELKTNAARRRSSIKKIVTRLIKDYLKDEEEKRRAKRAAIKESQQNKG